MAKYKGRSYSRTRAKGTSRGYKKSSARSSNKFWKGLIIGIVAILLIAATVLLIMEYGTPYKPSNGFKKVEQTQPLPDDKNPDEGNKPNEGTSEGDKKPDEGNKPNEGTGEGDKKPEESVTLSGQLSYDSALTDSTDFTGATVRVGDVVATVAADGKWTAKVPYGTYTVTAEHSTYEAVIVENFVVNATATAPELKFTKLRATEAKPLTLTIDTAEVVPTAEMMDGSLSTDLAVANYTLSEGYAEGTPAEGETKVTIVKTVTYADGTAYGGDFSVVVGEGKISVAAGSRTKEYKNLLLTLTVEGTDVTATLTFNFVEGSDRFVRISGYKSGISVTTKNDRGTAKIRCYLGSGFTTRSTSDEMVHVGVTYSAKYEDGTEIPKNNYSFLTETDTVNGSYYVITVTIDSMSSVTQNIIVTFTATADDGTTVTKPILIKCVTEEGE